MKNLKEALFFFVLAIIIGIVQLNSPLKIYKSVNLKNLEVLAQTEALPKEIKTCYITLSAEHTSGQIEVIKCPEICGPTVMEDCPKKVKVLFLTEKESSLGNKGNCLGDI